MSRPFFQQAWGFLLLGVAYPLTLPEMSAPRTVGCDDCTGYKLVREAYRSAGEIGGVAVVNMRAWRQVRDDHGAVVS